MHIAKLKRYVRYKDKGEERDILITLSYATYLALSQSHGEAHYRR